MPHSRSFPLARRLGSLHLPVCMIVALLQRTPVVRLLATAESVWVASPLAQVLRASAIAATVLGAVDTLAGATPVSPASPSPDSAQVGSPYAATFAVTGAPKSASSYAVSGLPPGLSVSGATFSAGSNTYSLNAPFGSITGTPTAAGSFSLTVTAWELANGAGAGWAYNYIITVSPAPNLTPVITIQPASQTVVLGASVTFSATASGTPPPAFQWQKNGVNIAGATGNTYTISAVASGDAGSYTVVATNSSGSATSNAAALSIIFPPTDAIITFTVE